jgi:hypothetical protein
MGSLTGVTLKFIGVSGIYVVSNLLTLHPLWFDSFRFEINIVNLENDVILVEM